MMPNRCLPPDVQGPPFPQFVFVDFENVHECLPWVIGLTGVHVTLLMGAKQTRLDAALVETMLAHSECVHLVRLASSGKNALDFILAYYLGRAATVHPAAQFHIISGDAGFDPLIHHLSTRQINVQRHRDFSTLPFAAHLAGRLDGGQKARKIREPRAEGTGEMLLEEKCVRAAGFLQRKPAHRPARRKTLSNYLKEFLRDGTAPGDIEAIIGYLCREGHISISTRGRVIYHEAPFLSPLLQVKEDHDSCYDDIPF